MQYVYNMKHRGWYRFGTIIDRWATDIREDIQKALENNPDVDGSDIEARIQNGEVVLTGSVKEERERTLIEDMVKNLQGVRTVQNEIEAESRVTGP